MMTDLTIVQDPQLPLEHFEKYKLNLKLIDPQNSFFSRLKEKN